MSSIFYSESKINFFKSMNTRPINELRGSLENWDIFQKERESWS